MAATLSAAAATLPPGAYTATIVFTDTTSGFAQSRTVQLTVDPIFTPFFTENFESGTLAPAFWTTSGTASWRTQITTEHSPHGGARQLTMDAATENTYSRNEATLTLNLAGQSHVALRFWAKEFVDEPEAPPDSPFPGGADFDGVAISADGVNWYEVQSLRELTTGWQRITVDLDAALAAHRLSYTAAFRIRFNQYDNNAIEVDGIAIDDLEVGYLFNNRLMLALSPVLAENGAPAIATISAAPTLVANLTLALMSSQPGALAVPATVTIPAGQNSASFAIAPQDDTLLNGTRTVSIAASAAGWAESGVVEITDDETAALTLNLPTDATEGDADQGCRYGRREDGGAGRKGR